MWSEIKTNVMGILVRKRKEKVLIDIKHPAQLNLFKGLSKQLKDENWEVTICYLKRGKLPKIIESEYAGFNTIPVGSSRGSKFSILWNGYVRRLFTFLDLIRKNRYDICVAASSIPLAMACKLSGTPIIQFYDDPERKRVNSLNERFSSQMFFPPIVEKTNKTSIFNCLKEWSYLSPKRFKPNPAVLVKYNLIPNQYVFVREVSNKSFNYYNQEDAIICSFCEKIDANTKVVLSLEDKSYTNRFPKSWIILEEPVEDIHSLIYYSKLVVSSGDSMAREGAMLGILSVYCGIRKMKANELLMKQGVLKHLPGEEAVTCINQTIDQPFDKGGQIEVRKRLLETWDDMNEFMRNQINQYKIVIK
jgi:predicted glycosyltransferase